MARLRLVRSPGETILPVGTVFPLATERTVIGRNAEGLPPGDGFVLIPLPAVARQHAAITRTDAGHVLADLDSRSGVYVNGELCKHERTALLAQGDVIKLCDFQFVFEADDAPEAVTPRLSSDSPSPPA